MPKVCIKIPSKETIFSRENEPFLLGEVTIVCSDSNVRNFFFRPINRSTYFFWISVVRIRQSSGKKSCNSFKLLMVVASVLPNI